MLTRLAMVLLVLLAGQAFGQTMVDLKTQSKSVDFSNLPLTKPATVGTVLPVSCQVGQMYFNSAAAPGSNLYGCTATNIWSLLSAGTGGNSGGGGGTGTTTGGATMASQLGDFATTLGSGILTIGANCSSATPCNVRQGNTVHSFRNAATVTASGSVSGLVDLYIDNGGNLVAASSVALTCSGCNYLPTGNVPVFPSDAIPLATWTVTSGIFDATGGTDFRATISIKNLLSGPGVLVSESNGTSTVSIDPSVVSLHVLTAPSSSSAACSAGQFSYDTSYYYICVNTNQWMRLALSSF